tara:strand:- start:352 stop:1215 length:864 start_codon:yes stop_codon:yes gene_type:complete
MPELPEVEVVKRSLEKNIKNLLIKKVTINNNKLRYKVHKKKFTKINNRKIISIKRISKYLIFNLNNNISILSHLGMTGKFFIINKNKRFKTSFYYNLSKKDKKHNHIIFFLNKKIKLIYNDVRRFGFIKIFKTSELMQSSHLRILGPEPLSKKFNFEYLKELLIDKKSSIKNILMNQNFVAGLGNIYVNEILFKSSVNPEKFAGKIKDFEIKKIINNSKKIIKKSILKGGSSIKDFNSVNGEKGNFQQLFSVYARNGRKCLKWRCVGIIKKKNISNRATFYCERCQK